MLTAGAYEVGRRMRAAMAALALALLLGGLAAVPAGANPRDPNVVNANNFIDWCFANGGTPNSTGYDSSGGIISVSCTFSDGSSLYCSFWHDGTTSCVKLDPKGNIGGYVPPPFGTGTAPPLTRPPCFGHFCDPVQSGGAVLKMVAADGGATAGSGHAPTPHKGHKHHGH